MAGRVVRAKRLFSSNQPIPPMNRRSAVRAVFVILWVVWGMASLVAVIWLRQTVAAPRGDPGYTASAVTFAVCLLTGAALVWRTFERLSTRSIRDIQEHSARFSEERLASRSKLESIR
jgi:hypothetical protein